MLLGVVLASLNTSSKPFFNFPQAGELQSHKINCHRSWGRTVRGIKPGSRLESNKYLLPFLSACCGNRCKMKFSDLWEASQTQLCCCCKQAVTGMAPGYLARGAEFVCPSRTSSSLTSLLHSMHQSLPGPRAQGQPH